MGHDERLRRRRVLKGNRARTVFVYVIKVLIKVF